MAMVAVNVHVTKHRVRMGRTRGRGAPGGWLWQPTCNCGWNTRQNRVNWWPRTFDTENSAHRAFFEHIVENQVDVYNLKLAYHGVR